MVVPDVLDNRPRNDLHRTYALLNLPFLRSSRLLAVNLSLIVAALGAARLVLPVDPAFMVVACLALAGAVGLACAEMRRNRTVVLNLFALAFLLRVVALALLSWGAARDGGSFLGVDSVDFLQGATYLADHGFHLGMSPTAFFGTYTVSQYYLFAAAIRYLHADLFALQMVNASLTALAAPLTFSIFRRVLPRVARASGLLVGVYPSLIVLSVVDLLKDPSVLCATLVAIWAVVSIMRTRRATAVVGLAVPGLLGLLYLRTARFYTLVYMEAGLACALVWLFVLGRTMPVRRTIRGAVVALVLMIAACEALPVAAGWPVSPVLFMTQLARASGTPALMHYSDGLVARLANGDAGGESPPGADALSFGADLVRRVMGPFPWIRPPRLDIRYLEANNYLLYPGMLVWYAMLPVILLGLLLVGRDLLHRTDVGFAIAFLWLFTVPYCLQYLAINLSYRQRDVMFPLLVVFAAVGSGWAARWPTFRRWYCRYWIALALLAAAHLTVRTLSGV